MSVFILISLSLFALYLIVFFSVFKPVPSSLSETFYKWEGRYNCGFVFMLALILMGVLLLPPFVSLSEGSSLQFLSFLCCASIMFVGAAPKFRDVGMESVIHPVAALISAASCVLWIVFVARVWWVLIIFLAAVSVLAIATKSLRCYVFWLEMAVFCSIYTTLLMM